MKYDEIEKIIGYVFKDKTLCDTAFRHSSYAYGNGLEDNERLEFFGDAILNYAVTEYLFLNVKNLQEGKLSKIKAKSVSTETLASIVEKLGLNKYLVLNANDGTSNTSKKTHANLFEAVLAAITLDSNVEVGKQFALKYIIPYIKEIMSSDVFDDYKTALQEYAQQYKLVLEYEFISKTGPEHNPEFCFVAKINDKKIGVGKGKNKAEAQYQAAKNAYNVLKDRGLEN
ncbi:MAG: ribonuclease III [Clostridia bacterium]|nr:ribonuclease III [Clostridia bacterium]MBR2302268.1 ribonuclease III [Clostridia bacterium]